MSRPLVKAVFAALAAAAVAALAVEPPPDGPPSYALGTVLVWRLEVAAAVAAALYAAIVVVALAFEGQTISRLGPGGVDIPPRRGAKTTGGALEETDLLARIVADASAGEPPAHETSSTKHQMSGERLRSDEKGD